MPQTSSKRYKIELGKFDKFIDDHKDKEYKTIVIGHKNPDADSVASAASYADLLRRRGRKNIFAGCAGIPQKRTQFLFKRFNMPLPKVYTDVSPRVADIVSKYDEPIIKGQTLLHATQMLSSHRKERMPIIDVDNNFEGMISLFDLAERMFQVGDDSEGMLSRTVNTSINLAAKALDAEILSSGEDKDEMSIFSLYIGAMNMYHLRTRLLENEYGNSALVVGDRGEIHNLGIELNVKLMVITGGCEIDTEFVKEAQKRKIAILKTPHDSASTVRRFKFSSPVELSKERESRVYTVNEKLSSIKHEILLSNHDGFAVVNKNGTFLGMFYKKDLQKEPPIRLIQVDHNEISQAVEGADELLIEEIVDHHRLGMNPTDKPIRVTNDVVGSTCTLVAEQYRQSLIDPDKNMAGIMLGGIITDTLFLRSPTSTERDARMIEWLAGIAECDPEKLEQEILNSGSPLANLTPDELINTDLKMYEEHDISFGIGQIEEAGFESLNKHLASLKKALHNNRESKKLDFVGLMVTNVVRSTSVMLVEGKEGIVASLPFDRLEEGLYDLPGIVSRKKQLLPLIINILADNI